MTHHPSFDFDKMIDAHSNDYHLVPATDKQLQFAHQIAARLQVKVPGEALGDRQKMTAWIDKHKAGARVRDYSNYPSSKQVAFAESIARRKRRDVPRECFRDRRLMSNWISHNL